MPKLLRFLLPGLLIVMLSLSGCAELAMIATVSPKPVIVQSGCDTYWQFEYGCKVWADIRNDGGSGYIIFTAEVTQGSGKWTKNKELYLSKHTQRRVEIDFPEVGFTSGQIHYQCWAN